MQYPRTELAPALTTAPPPHESKGACPLERRRQSRIRHRPRMTKVKSDTRHAWPMSDQTIDTSCLVDFGTWQ
eukprot:2016242-Pyramimonas_sp.AAC.1